MPDAPTVSNSSCLIGLEAVGCLDVLQQLYTTIDVPEAVAQECGSGLPSWVQVRSVQSQSLVQFLKLDLGAGEAEAIALSVECSAARLILDDKKARRVARQLNQPVAGTNQVLNMKWQKNGRQKNKKEIGAVLIFLPSIFLPLFVLSRLARKLAKRTIEPDHVAQRLFEQRPKERLLSRLISHGWRHREDSTIMQC